ncbi:MAG: hypothetical protein SOY30_07825 [Eubacteriales bacterium]|nr:hypothetical protein [Eubacteriales bacterium]
MRRGKEFLLRAEIMERRIDAALRKVELFRSLAERVTSHWGKESVTHSRNVSANEDAIIQLMEVEEQLKQLCAEYGVIVSEITAVLAALENREDERLLSDIFLKHQPLEQIAAREHVTKSCVYKRCGRALDALERLLCS